MMQHSKGYPAPPAQQAPQGDLLGEWGDLPLTAFFRRHADQVNRFGLAAAFAAAAIFALPFLAR